MDISFIIVVIFVSFLIGLIYLVYLPFKNWLKKSGKLTKKLDQTINWAFLLLPCFILFVLYCLKDYRTPSKDRLEKISAIHLPFKSNVLKDEYQDMLQDYCILYNIKFDSQTAKELIKNIKTSKFYNSNSFHNGAWKENDFITVDSARAVWSKSPKGFDFSRQDGLTLYYIEIDTTTNILKYNECAD